MKKITIEPGCISCGSCTYFAPDVFEIVTISRVRENVDLQAHTDNIRIAAEKCPMQIITFEE